MTPLKRLKLFGSVLLICSLPHSSGAFNYNLDGWENFQFGQSWESAKQALSDRCWDTERLGKGDLLGRSCGTWLGLDIDVRIFADEGGWFGFGKKLRGLEIWTEFSQYSGNTVLRFLRNEFELTRDYSCYHKEVDSHRCTIIFKNGQVVFQDNLLHNDREIIVELRNKELYAPGTFD